ncbi:hypothetical protein CVT26_005598 [Gymnopilus dilepis]|uniref:Uncharacterized protein n=1 Tax=Gymnopilus dilepis TaxID=231916 RepID=A0A409XZP1_9AGAR|nr:hypothetical protein CVT26_005598 [Gymnopilus dilepis]
MKTSSALLSFTTLSVVLFKFGVSASPVLATDESSDTTSNDLLIRGPFLPGTEGPAAEDKLLLRADSYGWDHHRKHWGWRRELDATTKGTTKSTSQHYGPHHYRHHWWHHHHYKYPRDENDEGAPEDNVDIDDDNDSAMADQMKREDAYGRYWHYHHKGYYRRDDSDPETDLGVIDNDKREEGYSRHHYHKKHGYGYYRRDKSDEDGALSPFDNEKREEGYSRHHYHKKHGYYRRDDTDPEDSLGPVDQDRREEGYYRHHHYPKYHYPRDDGHVEDGLLDERDDDAAQRHRHYKYPRDTDHWGWRWRHHHKLFHREEDMELPSDLDLEAIAEREVEHRYHHPYHKYPRDLVGATNADNEEGHPKKATAEDIKEGVAHGVTTGAKEAAAGILGYESVLALLLAYEFV